MSKLRLLNILLAVVASIGWAMPAYALISAPDSPPTLTDKHANRNLIETGDMLIYAVYNLPYAVPPTTPISQTFIWRLIDSDNVTELGSVLAYPENDYGYNQGVIAFYFTASAAPAWGGSYTIRLDGNPTQFASPPTYNFALDAGTWSTFTSQTANRAEVRSNIIDIAKDLDVAWGLTTTNSLVQQTDTGTVLSENGAGYFNYAIVGLQSMCPALYFAVVNTINWASVNRTYTPTLPTTYSNRLVGSWPGVAVSSIGNFFGTGYSATGSGIVLLGLMVLIVVGALVSGSALSGFLAGVVWVVVGLLLGWVPMAALFIASLICLIYMGALLINRLIA